MMAVHASHLPPPPRSWEEYEALEALEDNRRFEMLAGEVFEIMPPIVLHQSIIALLTILLGGFVRTNRLGKVYPAPVALRPNPHADWAEPDLVWVSNGSTAITGVKWIEGAAELVVEVVSPSSVRRDYTIKKALYARWGVRYYWIVDPRKRVLEPYRLDPATGLYLRAHEQTEAVDGAMQWSAEPFLGSVQVPLEELWTP